MNTKASAILERLAVSSLEACLSRLTKVSAGTWKRTGTAVYRGTLSAAVKRHDFKDRSAAAIHFSVGGGFPFTSFMLFDPEDIEFISKCFVGYSFARTSRLSRPEEIMLLELGNIILNSLINAVLNTLKKSSMPMLPQYLEGDFRSVVSALARVIDLKRNFTVITSTLVLQCDKSVRKSEVFAMIPDELAAELERIS